MQVIYSIGGCTFAGKGIGQTAYQGVRALYRHKLLKKLIVSSRKSSEISNELIETVPSNPRGLNRILGERYASLIKDSLHDFLTAQKIESCDIFHGWAGMSLKSGRRAKELGAKYVVQRASSHILTQKKLLQEEYEQWGIKEKPILPQVVDANLAEYKEADYILVPSEFAKDSFIEHKIPEKKLLMIPFGVKPDRGYPLRGVTPHGEKFIVLYVGQISLRKGIPYLLQAWQELGLKNAELILVGKIERNIQSTIQQFNNLPRRQAGSTIKFTGFQSPDSYYQSADIFVFPSIEEGSALVTYEALAFGLPVITTANSGSVVHDGIEGFVVPIRDVEALKEKILALYQNKELYEKMSTAARRRAGEFSWEKHGEKLVEVYKNL